MNYAEVKKRSVSYLSLSLTHTHTDTFNADLMFVSASI